MESVVSTVKTPVVSGARYREAFEATLEEIKAIEEEDTTVINLDIPSTVATVVGAVPEIAALRAELKERAPQFDIGVLDNLERYALALFHTHMLAQVAAQPPEVLIQLGEQATALRQQLVSDVTALSYHNLIPAEPLSKLKGPPGYLNLASDLYLLAGIVRANWSSVDGKTAISEAVLAQAEDLSERLVVAYGLREQGAAALATSTSYRSAAFTLLVTAYDQVRRGVTFLRWDHNDVESIAPTLYGGRSRRKGSELTAAKGGEPKPTPGTAVPIVVAPPITLMGDPAAPIPAATRSMDVASAGANGGLVVSVPSGLPGGAPFVRN